MTDMSGDVAKRFGTAELRDDALTVVHDLETGLFVLANSGDVDPAGAGIQAVLNELGERLAGIGLAHGQPANKLERVMDAEPTLLGVGGEFFSAFSAFAFGFLGVGHLETVP